MRDVNYGWLLRYLHANGASMFFLAVYIHIFRGMYYGSYKSPREVLWIFGVIIYLLMMATGFMGYVLPWGQMSYWARDRHHQPVLGHPGGRRDHRDVAVGRLCGRQSDAGALLLAALPAAVRHLRRRRCCTSGRCTWSARTIRRASTRRPRRTRCRSRRTPRSRTRSCIARVLHPLCVVRVLNPELSRPRGQLHAGQSGGDAVATSCRNGTTCRSTRSCARSRTSSLGVLRDVRFDRHSAVRCPGSTGRACKSAKYRPLYQAVLLAVRRDLRPARLARHEEARRQLRAFARVLTAWYFIHFIVVLPLLGLFERPKPLPRRRSSRAVSSAAITSRSPGAAARCRPAAVGPAMRRPPRPPGHRRPARAAGHSRRRRRPQAEGDRCRRANTGRSQGSFGKYDTGQLQRGFKVYHEVCQQLSRA